LSVSHVPPGATIKFRAGPVSQTVIAAKTGAARITRIGRLIFPNRSTYSLKITEPNWIGAYRVFIVPAGKAPYPIREQCVRPTGPQGPVRCATVDRGR